MIKEVLDLLGCLSRTASREWMCKYPTYLTQVVRSADQTTAQCYQIQFIMAISGKCHMPQDNATANCLYNYMGIAQMFDHFQMQKFIWIRAIQEFSGPDIIILIYKHCADVQYRAVVFPEGGAFFLSFRRWWPLWLTLSLGSHYQRYAVFILYG